MIELDRARADGAALFDDVIGALAADPDAGGEGLALLREQAATLADLTFHVVACGEAKRGKSSLLNALILRPGLFPVDMDIATSVVTTLGYGETEHAVAVLGTGDGGEEQVELPVAEIGKFVSEQENPGNRRRVRLVRAVAPIPTLKSGMTLVDTPGIGGRNPAHDAATHAFLGRADALLFVCGANEVLGDDELEFLERALAKCPVLVTAVAKKDLVVDMTPVLDDTRTKITKRTGRNPDELVIVPVSANACFDALEDDDDDKRIRSGLPALEDELWTRLAVTVGARRVSTCVVGLINVVDAVSAPIRVELAADDGTALAKIDAELAEHQKQAKALQTGSASWRSDLRRALGDVGTPARRRLKDAFSLLESSVLEAAATADSAADLEPLLRDVGRLMIDHTEAASAELERGATAALAEFAERTRIPLEPELGNHPVERPSFTPVRSLEVAAEPALQPGRNMRTIWRSAISGAGIFGVLGGLVGSVGGPPGIWIGATAGGLIGKVLGGLFGWQDAKQEALRAAEKRREDLARRQLVAVKENVRAQIKSSSVRALAAFDDAVDDMQRTLTRDLDRQIDLARETTTRSQRQLAARRERTAAEQAARRTELQRLDMRNTDWLDRADTLLERLGGIGAGR